VGAGSNRRDDHIPVVDDRRGAIDDHLGRVTGPPECGVSGQLLLTQPPRWCVPAGAGNHRDRVAGREGIGGGVIYPAVVELELVGLSGQQDRKSTRLNSSHVSISYAVFCLKKKTTR